MLVKINSLVIAIYTFFPRLRVMCCIMLFYIILNLFHRERKHVIYYLYYDILIDSANLVAYCLIQLSVILIPTKTDNLMF